MSRRAGFLVTPTKLTGELVRACATVCPHTAPAAIKAVPFPGCGLDPAANLTAQTARHGGSVLWGWRVAAWPRVMVQLERHAVWLSPSGETIDITPSPDPGPATVFIADPAAETEADGLRRAPLTADAVLARYLDLAATRPDGADEVLDAFLAVVRRFAKPADPCWCGSGRQLRKCHPLP